MEMKYKKSKLFLPVNHPKISQPIYVRFDGKAIIYHGQEVNQYLVKGKHRRGHYAVCIENTQLYRSRLVATAFVPNPDNYPCVLHNDCNSTHDYYRNLSWGTRQMLGQNMIANGLTERPTEWRGHSKISHPEALKIMGRLHNGEAGRKIAAEYGVSEMTICRIKKKHSLLKAQQHEN